MSIYKNTYLNSIVSLNDYNTHVIANNLYEKIKKLGILPSWIKRETEIKKVTVTSDSATPLILNDLFTFGVGLGQGTYNIGEAINLGKVHEISFEVYSTEPYFIVDYSISGTNYLSIDLDELGVFEEFMLIRIERNHLDVIIYVNEVEVFSGELDSDEDYILQNTIVEINTDTIQIGNLKVTRGSKILHWWKFNTFKTIDTTSDEILFTCNQIMFQDYIVENTDIIVGNCSHEFIDEGYNSKDFYSFWYTVAFFFALIISYSKTLLFLRNTYIKTKFIQSKGIFTGNSSDSEVDSIYDDWKLEISRRGTFLPFRDKSEGLGVGRLLRAEDYLKMISPINIGTNHRIGFDVEVIDGNFSIEVMDCISFEKTGFTSHTITYSHDTNDVSVSFSSELKFFRIIVDKTSSGVSFNVNGDLYYEEVVSSSVDLVTGNACVVSLGSNDIAIANLSIEDQYVWLKYPFKEEYSFFNETYTKDDLYTIYIGSDVQSIVLAESFYISDNFDNKSEMNHRGEYLRLTRYNAGEFTGGMIPGIELGECVGYNSFCFNSTIGIPAFNKIYSKPIPINSSRELPFIDNKKVSFSGEEITITTDTLENVSNGVDFVSRISLDKFKLYVDPSYDYEFNFKIKSSNSLMGLRFGFAGFTSDGSVCNLIDAKTGLTISSNIAYIYQTDDYPYLSPTYDFIQMRSKIMKSGTSSNILETLSIGVGRNLIFQSTCAYVAPIIEIFSKENSVSKEAIIKDIHFGLLKLPIGRGYIGYKNTFILLSKNNSNDSFIINDVYNKLIPYNTISKIIHI